MLTRAISIATRGARALLGSSSRGVRTAAGVGVGLVATDAVVIPALEGVTGRDLPGGTLTRDGFNAVANSTGQVAGATQVGFMEGVTQGASVAILGDTPEARQIGTIALLGVGALVLLTVVRR